jgi:hypothetical protein
LAVSFVSGMTKQEAGTSHEQAAGDPAGLREFDIAVL